MNEAIDQSTEMMPGDEQAEKAGKLRWGNIAIWAVIIIILAALGWGLINVNAPRPEAGQQAPAFEMEFFDGFGWQGQDVATLEEMRGKVVVLNFWASWCVECRLEADLLEQASRAYGDDVVFLGIAYVDSEPKSLSYLNEFDITYPNAPDLRSEISDSYEITGVPETFFIDKNGQVTWVQIGPVSADLLYGQIDQLLAQEG